MTQHHRRSIRLQGYDYTTSAAYFVTVCVAGRECLLGDIVDGQMILSAYGRIVQACWEDLPSHYLHVELDACMIMPNHAHGVICLLSDPEARAVVGAGLRPAPTTAPTAPTIRHGLPEVVRAYKSFSARHINALRNARGQAFWQRNYYERIIRNDRELNAIRKYIEDNPMQWALDRDNPTNRARIGNSG